MHHGDALRFKKRCRKILVASDRFAVWSGFVARICRISPDVLNKIDEGRFQRGVLSCRSNNIRRDAVTFPGKGIE